MGRHEVALADHPMASAGGALMPGTTGAYNPSMTIAAVAEHSMDTIVRADVSTLI